MDSRHTLAAVVLAVAFASSAAAAEDGVAGEAEKKAYAVIVDDDLPIYRTVVTGIGVESLGVVDEYTLGGDASLGPEVMQRVLQDPPAAIIAVGPKAAGAARAAKASVPIVYCMVPRLESYRFDDGKSVGVRLERSYRAQLSALKALLPKASRVAVLYNPARSGHTIRLARKAASDNGLELVGVEIGKPDEAASALGQVAGKADALWMISDPTVLNLQTVDAMLAFSTEQRLPFIALNARFVERGALLAFSVDYARLGRQVGRIANQVVFEGAAADKIGLVAPEGLDVAFNLSTAERVGEGAELSANVLSYAAEHQHSLRVFR